MGICIISTAFAAHGRYVCYAFTNLALFPEVCRLKFVYCTARGWTLTFSS